MPSLDGSISTKKAKITVVGLGYVGLPIAVAFAKKGFCVYGFDTKASRVKRLKRGISYISDVPSGAIMPLIKGGRFIPVVDEAVLNKSDVIIICVPTPLKKRKTPDISYIIKVAKVISRHLKPGQLIVLESTTYPGTTRDVMLPILEKSGLKEGKDFFLSFSPERIDPGNRKYDFSNIPKVIGGVSKKAGWLTKKLYSHVIKKVISVDTAEAAEVVKLLENSFRIVNIGLINEFAMLCHKLGIDVWDVIEAAKTKPFGFMPFYPGPGVGGHCISTDPLYLSWKARRVGFVTKMIDLAAKTNLDMPDYVVSRAEALLQNSGKSLSKAKILILGVTYKKDIKDLRESPALDIIGLLKKKKADVAFHDPYVPYLDIKNIRITGIKLNKQNLKKFDLVILATGHNRFDYNMVAANSKKVLDTRNAFSKHRVQNINIVKL
jgi:UDP-N-acetyl-D-glucosamine dehydrogenase